MSEQHTIPSLVKAIDVLMAIAAGPADVNVGELAERLGIPNTTCYRIIKTFCASNWVRNVEGRGYVISAGLMPVALQLSQSVRLKEVCQPLLNALAAAGGLGVKLSIRQGDEAFSVAKADSPRAMALTGRTGVSFPLVIGSSGAVFLAGLPDAEVKRIISAAPKTAWEHQSREEVLARVAACCKDGYCADLGGYKPHIHTISAPVRSGGETVAAITILGLPDELTPELLPRLSKLLMAEAAKASDLLA